MLEHDMAGLAGFYERVAALVGRPAPHEVVLPVSVPALAGLDGNSGTVRILTAPVHPRPLWVEECLRHLSSHAQAITGPASHMTEQRRLPWWR
jgi:hypothetical protein